MHCSSCAAEQPPGARFCAACGASVGAPRRSAAEKLRALLTPAAVAVLAGLVLLAGVGVAAARDRSRGHDLAATRGDLASTRTDLDGTKAKLAETEKKLAAEAAKAAKLNTELTGVRGSLTATSKERDSMKSCFSGFLEAINSGDRTKVDAIFKRIEADCEKIDHLLD